MEYPSLHQSYSFWFYNSDTRINVTFLGPLEWKFCGADHTYPHSIRRSWALSLLNTFPDSWRALPLHEYLDCLRRRGFDYDEYLVRRNNLDREVHILCRTVQCFTS